MSLPPQLSAVLEKPGLLNTVHRAVDRICDSVNSLKWIFRLRMGPVLNMDSTHPSPTPIKPSHA